jgi:2-oxoglutarate ferredoxin oxidoreductase subunit gamma
MGGNRWEICLAGVGGQGLALAGQILAEAAGVYDGRNVVQVESHGVSSRGGRSRSEIIIADGEIDYPGVRHADVLLAMTSRDLQDFASIVKDNGLIVVDASVAPSTLPPNVTLRAIPLLELARQRLGNPVVVNMIALGAIARLSGAVTRPALEKAIRECTPERQRENNLRALSIGFEVVDGE